MAISESGRIIHQPDRGEDLKYSGLRFGLYLPKQTLTNEMIGSWGVQTKNGVLTADGIRQRTGVKSRRIAARDQSVGDMARSAVDQTLSTPKGPDMFLVSTSFPTGDLAGKLKRELMPHSGGGGAINFHFACSGFVEMLAHMHENPDRFEGKDVLLIASERYSSFLVDLQKKDGIKKDPSLAQTIFSDGAAAMRGKFGTDFQVLSAVRKEFPEHQNSLTMPVSEDLMAGEHYSYHVPYSPRFYQDGPKVYSVVRENVPGLIEAAIEKANLGYEDIDVIVPHQGSIHVVEDGIAKQLPKEQRGKVVLDIEDGNFSSASVPKALKQAFEEGKRIKKGGTAVLAGFGAGLYSVAVVVKF